jgi:sugar transferase (PEP-CTERM system associated)
MHTPYIVLAAVECVLIFGAVCVGHRLRLGEWPPGDWLFFLQGAIYAAVSAIGMVAMGVYEAHIREGYVGMMLRTAVGLFLIASMIVAVVYYVLPGLALGRGVLAVAALTSFVLIGIFRWLSLPLLDQDRVRRRVLVLGTGARAARIASRMRRRYDQRAFRIVGYVPIPGTTDLVSAHGAEVLHFNEPLPDVCRQHRVQEIVVALDERRRDSDGTGGLPLDELLECRMDGVSVMDIQAFIECESGKLDIGLLQPSWMVYSDGFVRSPLRNGVKRLFDIVVSLTLLVFASPVMLLAALAIWLESGCRGPVLYRQQRVGLDGRYFEVMKFRSMGIDAEVDGRAVWAALNDPRVTRVGRVIRTTRIDELPQVFNVLKGDMSFVGPRPERPEFVADLAAHIPYYEHRHRVKPGITGWAQLCYPYGASVDDAREKLQYDLYYLKNHSLLLDLIILVQTVDVILVGEGAR